MENYGGSGGGMASVVLFLAMICVALAFVLGVILGSGVLF